jgi:hypothetical protein
MTRPPSAPQLAQNK